MAIGSTIAELSRQKTKALSEGLEGAVGGFLEEGRARRREAREERESGMRTQVMQQQMSLTDLQIDAGQRKRQEELEAQRLLKKNKGDMMGTAHELQEAGMTDKANEFAMQHHAQQKAQADATTQQFEMYGQQADFFGNKAAQMEMLPLEQRAAALQEFEAGIKDQHDVDLFPESMAGMDVNKKLEYLKGASEDMRAAAADGYATQLKYAKTQEERLLIGMDKLRKEGKEDSFMYKNMEKMYGLNMDTKQVALNKSSFEAAKAELEVDSEQMASLEKSMAQYGLLKTDSKGNAQWEEDSAAYMSAVKAHMEESGLSAFDALADMVNTGEVGETEGFFGFGKEKQVARMRGQGTLPPAKINSLLIKFGKSNTVENREWIRKKHKEWQASKKK